MPGSILGTRVVRVEDPDLLKGQGTFVGDVKVEGLTHLAFARSAVPHGRIVRIDTSEASAHPGVLGVFTAADIAVPPFHYFMVLNESCARPPLARSRVRFAGGPGVRVVDETLAAAAHARR